jgi:hypothetical protein
LETKKRYWHNCVEEAVMNRDYDGYRYFRVEVYDNESDNQYSVMEGSFLVPTDLFETLYEAIDGYESDLPLSIQLERPEGEL